MPVLPRCGARLQRKGGGLLGKAMAGRTTILITHDLALTAAADYLVTLGSARKSLRSLANRSVSG